MLFKDQTEECFWASCNEEKALFLSQGKWHRVRGGRKRSRHRGPVMRRQGDIWIAGAPTALRHSHERWLLLVYYFTLALSYKNKWGVRSTNSKLVLQKVKGETVQGQTAQEFWLFSADPQCPLGKAQRVLRCSLVSQRLTSISWTI